MIGGFMAKKIPMTQELFSEFKANPEATLNRFGIHNIDPAFFAEIKKCNSFQDFKDFIQKSRFMSFFDLKA
jgi:hypothetical protein